ncbi:phosphatidate cytidylyltransferase [Candidatus Latescibacterota bacterium]
MISESTLVLLSILVVLSLFVMIRMILGRQLPLDSYIYRIWLLLLFIGVAYFISFSIGIWILALICFTALREYFSLIDIRLQDRLGILGGYLSIPFMIYYIHTGWYNMFIITIPVYSFLAIPLLVTLGGRETRGTVFSVGSIDLGLFLFVYCLGHIGYLVRFSLWMAVLLILCVAVCDVISFILHHRIHRPVMNLLTRYALPLPLTVSISLLLSPWAVLPTTHAVMVGLLIPLLVIMGHYTIDYIKADLGVDEDVLLPGRGQILDNMKSLFYAAPIVFHYYKYFCT